MLGQQRLDLVAVAQVLALAGQAAHQSPGLIRTAPRPGPGELEERVKGTRRRDPRRAGRPFGYQVETLVLYAEC